MGRYKEFLINEQMRITGNWREKDHHEYLAWRKNLDNEHQQEERRKEISRGDKQRDSKDTVGLLDNRL
jgi:hypothetical protein